MTFPDLGTLVIALLLFFLSFVNLVLVTRQVPNAL